MIEFSCPGKTFICGEYGVLVGGDALVACTAPRFLFLDKRHPRLSEIKNSQNYAVTSFENIHPESQAGKWMATHQEIWSDYVFCDPYKGQGGFGASTAQFLFAYFLTEKNIQLVNLHRSFLQVSNQDSPPSGVDLLAQIKGQITRVNRETGECQSLTWPFDDLEFFIIPTGFKVATHEHLKNVVVENLQDLANFSKQLVQTFAEKKSDAFVAGIEDWGARLNANGFLAPTSAEIIEKLRELPGVVAIKGCGALGADTVFILVKKLLKQDFIAEFKSHHQALGLTGSYKTISDLSHGFEVHHGN